MRLALDLLWGQLLEEADIAVGGVVDEHVDRSEPVNRRLDGGLGVQNGRFKQISGTVPRSARRARKRNNLPNLS
jgi:hypothetical protein